MQNCVEGNIVDLYHREIYPGIVNIEDGKIKSIIKNDKLYNYYIAPGFIDSHVHIESSMLTPFEFSKLAIQKGTVAVVNDPHEIANVLGVSGIKFMIDNSKSAFMKIFFTTPSCVPATRFDASGCQLSLSDIEYLLSTQNFIGLSEMMNIQGVLSDDPEVKAIIELFRKKNLIIDGHAPGLSGSELKKYIDAGISTDHEHSTLKEALEKIEFGMDILIREGSAAKNYDSLKSLIATHPDRVMFCTDDSHPGDLIKEGHIDKIVRKAISDGFDLYDVLTIASINPIKHYGLSVGSLRPGDSADFTVFQDLKSFSPIGVYLNGEDAYKASFCKYTQKTDSIIKSSKSKFKRAYLDISEVSKPVNKKTLCIQIFKNEIFTKRMEISLSSPLKNLESDLNRDILKIVYLNRYIENSKPQIAFISGIGLKRGAFATSISHDSHNILAVGTNDSDLIRAINAVIAENGGLCIVDNQDTMILPLPIAGIMSDKTGEEVAEKWNELIQRLNTMGCFLNSPFMTLSFMALIVIPELKIGEQGLFDFSKFNFIPE